MQFAFLAEKKILLRLISVGVTILLSGCYSSSPLPSFSLDRGKKRKSAARKRSRCRLCPFSSGCVLHLGLPISSSRYLEGIIIDGHHPHNWSSQKRSIWPIKLFLKISMKLCDFTSAGARCSPNLLYSLRDYAIFSRASSIDKKKPDQKIVPKGSAE